MTDPVDLAYTLYNEIEGCMSDLAEGDEIQADDNWNDPDVISDLLGDRLFDSCNRLLTDEDKILAWEVTDQLLKIGDARNHKAFEKAVYSLKKRQGLM